MQSDMARIGDDHEFGISSMIIGIFNRSKIFSCPFHRNLLTLCIRPLPIASHILRKVASTLGNWTIRIGSVPSRTKSVDRVASACKIAKRHLKSLTLEDTSQWEVRERDMIDAAQLTGRSCGGRIQICSSHTISQGDCLWTELLWGAFTWAAIRSLPEISSPPIAESFESLTTRWMRWCLGDHAARCFTGHSAYKRDK